jgi:hypothetical protein
MAGSVVVAVCENVVVVTTRTVRVVAVVEAALVIMVLVKNHQHVII